MRARTYSITEIREVISSLPEEFEKDVDIVTVIQEGKLVMTILPTSTYVTLKETIESLLETLEVLEDEELMASFRQGVKEMAEGRFIPWEEVKRDLGIDV